MVTHDAFAASYADKVIALKDGIVFGELVRHGQPRDSSRAAQRVS